MKIYFSSIRLGGSKSCNRVIRQQEKSILRDYVDTFNLLEVRHKHQIQLMATLIAVIGILSTAVPDPFATVQVWPTGCVTIVTA